MSGWGPDDTLSGTHSINASITPNFLYRAILEMGGDLVAPDGFGHYDQPVPSSISFSVYIVVPTITIDPSWLTNNPGACVQSYTLQTAPTSSSIQNISASEGTVTLNCQGVSSTVYDVQRATDVLFTQNLITLLTTNAPSGGLFIYTDPNPPGTAAFYRLRQR
jgi:hypothetical protein